MLVSIAISFITFGFLFVIFSATSTGGFGRGLTGDQMLGLGVIIFAMGLAFCIIATGRKNKKVTAA
jgi:hypothetical protein